MDLCVCVCTYVHFMASILGRCTMNTRGWDEELTILHRICVHVWSSISGKWPYKNIVGERGELKKKN